MLFVAAWKVVPEDMDKVESMSEIEKEETVSRTTKDDISDLCDLLKQALIDKNTDYGDSALTEPLFTYGVSTEQAIAVRFGDKIKRLENLCSGYEINYEYRKVKNETINDTLLDVAGYALLWLIARAREE